MRTFTSLSNLTVCVRRRHKRLLKAGKIYPIKSDWFHKTGYKIKITKVYRQRLGDITLEETLKEDDYTVGEFMLVWIRINGRWDPDEIVVVYEFKLVEPPDQHSV